MISARKLKIAIVCDNYRYKENVENDWSFSCIIEGLQKKILFDTGSDGKILLSNMKKMNFEPKEIDIVFLSHFHFDHIGGLYELLKCNREVTVFVLKSFPEKFKNEIKAIAKVVEIEKVTKVFDSVYSTGELGSLVKEQSLVIDTKEGLVVITGCAHPGIINIVKKVKENFSKKVLLLIGGFHLFSESVSEIIKIAKELKESEVSYICPCHCTGDIAIEIFKKSFGNRFVECGAGKVIELLKLFKQL